MGYRAPLQVAPREKPQPTLGLNELRQKAHALSQRRSDAIRDYERYAEQEADADRDFRITLAKRFTQARSDSEPAGASEIIARAAAAEAKHKCAIASSLAKSSLLRIEECERDAATLRSVADWSRSLDGGTA